MDTERIALLPDARKIHVRYSAAGLLFHDIDHPAFLIQTRAAADACLAITRRHADLSPGEFLFEAITKLAEDFYRRKLITEEEFDKAIQPLLCGKV